MGRAGGEAMAARAHDAHFVVSGMNGCLHGSPNLIRALDSKGLPEDSATEEGSLPGCRSHCSSGVKRSARRNGRTDLLPFPLERFLFETFSILNLTLLASVYRFLEFGPG
jgi:hypothetical protein